MKTTLPRVQVLNIQNSPMHAHVCCVSDATDEEILAVCNAHPKVQRLFGENKTPPEWEGKFFYEVIRKIDPLRVGFEENKLPVCCEERPQERIHVLVANRTDMIFEFLPLIAQQAKVN